MPPLSTPSALWWRHLSIFVLVILTASCLSDDSINGLTVPAKSSPFTCEQTAYFTKTGSGSIANAFFMGESQDRFYSIGQNRIYQYDLNTLQIRQERSFLPLQVSASYFASRDDQSGWLILQHAVDNSWTANVLDTTTTIISSVSISMVNNDNNGYVVAATPDKGFVVAANPSTTVNINKYTVSRFSETGALLWQKQLTNLGRITCILALRSGGYLVGGSTIAGTPATRNSFLAKLDNLGNEVWQKAAHKGDLNSEYSINDLYEDTSGDYFLLLHNQRSSLAVLRSDTAYTISWNKTVYNSPQVYFMKMTRMKNEVLVYYTGGTGYISSFDIGFSSLSDAGSINWGSTFGGTGDEAVYAFQHVPTIGYYLIGRTDNYDGVNAVPISNTYLIKTDLGGLSCK